MTLKQSILATLTYHDLFYYPLTKEEIFVYLISKKTNTNILTKELYNLQTIKNIIRVNDYYCLARRKHIIKERQKRSKISAIKYKKALLYANILKFVPSIQLVAISGALAMKNCKKGDDVDLFIITKPKQLWISRLLANILLIPFKRRPKEETQNSKACLNLFISAQDLKIKDENIYTAHEICQMKILWQRNGIYRIFLSSNKWIIKYLPNWKPQNILESPKVNINLTLAEKISKNIQILYMKSKITTEKITDNQLFFHPQNTQKRIIEKYHQHIKNI